MFSIAGSRSSGFAASMGDSNHAQIQTEEDLKEIQTEVNGP